MKKLQELLSKFKERVQKFMVNRNGFDHLVFVIACISIIISLFAAIYKSFVLSIISVILLIYVWFRICSKKIENRQFENQVFLVLIKKCRKAIKRWISRIKNSRKYKYFKCPKCKQSLRVPRKKGNIVITCPKCRNKFDVRS